VASTLVKLIFLGRRCGLVIIASWRPWRQAGICLV
jgi:hypothetical protein